MWWGEVHGNFKINPPPRHKKEKVRLCISWTENKKSSQWQDDIFDASVSVIGRETWIQGWETTVSLDYSQSWAADKPLCNFLYD